ncbi:DNA primase small subunit PriS [Haloquadratum walsbyi]|jgi:DNA primase small subunit|uniref:DNA primase small subunit PriS n=1 Tax=Haloquadratum walsbyi TaxID=293091 RepID=UPI0015F3A2FB|nr:DNA primase small subunit PriS [Haloquadratum walsbyi]
MEDRTRTYLKGRFGDYYARARMDTPPAANRREWGHIPWSAGSTTMVRHQSLLELGTLDDFLHRTAPKHIYFSAARFNDPGATTMDQKDWQSADLIFDLDADHLPGVNPDTTSYADMLTACKTELQTLLEFIDDDFNFDETQVVFSGGRGYHVHVRDEQVRSLDSAARREIVDYIRAIDLNIETLIETQSNHGTTQRILKHRGGWGQRIHKRLVELIETLQASDDTEALERLQSFEGIGTGRAETILGQIQNNPEAIHAGNLEAGGAGIRILADALAQTAFEAETAPIDEPVTTDTNRLIRLPGSLHGGSGLLVTPLDREEIPSFHPLEHAIADRFRGRDIQIRITDSGVTTFDGETFDITEGNKTVEECLGIFLMARGRAEKVTE